MTSRPLLGLAGAALAVASISCGGPTSPVAQESSSIGEPLPQVEPLPEDENVATLPPAAELPLSIDDALLHADDAPVPWDMRNRDVETFAHDIGPNQTDCGPYWEYERVGRLPGGETMWWRDGGNLNNMVRREAEPGQAAELIRVFADLPQTCAVTSWSEGDSFTIDALDLSGVPGTKGIVALSIDHVRTDEVLWLAFAQRGDLISELRVTMWPEFESDRIPAFSRDDFAAVAATMAARLAAAGPDRAAPTTTTTTTVPGQRPDELPPTLPNDVSDDDVPELEPPSPELTIPPIDVPATTLAPLSDLAAALLVTHDLPENWRADRATEHDQADSGDEPLDGCPESIVIVELKERFEYSTELAATDVETWESFGMQFIAELSDSEDGTQITSSFLAVDGCTGGDEYATYLLSATALDVRGADTAVLVEVNQSQTVDVAGAEDDEFETRRFALAIATVGTTLTAFSLSGDAPVLDFLQRAVDKIVASGPF